MQNMEHGTLLSIYLSAVPSPSSFPSSIPSFNLFPPFLTRFLLPSHLPFILTLFTFIYLFASLSPSSASCLLPSIVILLFPFHSFFSSFYFFVCFYSLLPSLNILFFLCPHLLSFLLFIFIDFFHLTIRFCILTTNISIVQGKLQ